MVETNEQSEPKLRDRERTRARILSAAQIAFTKLGYKNSNMRDIAAEAGINASLVIRYFGSKEELFEKAIEEVFDLGQAFAGIDRQTLGKAIATRLFSRAQDTDLMAMMLLAATDPSMNESVRRLASARMLRPMMKLIGGKDAERRATLILAIVTGIWVYRFMLPLKTVSARAGADIVDQIAQLIQQLVDGED
ncbi:TetR/AcrR family transcriptional regulator [Paraburkholderia lycopersici]|uniref:Regulatory protein, tetR family n=1 Tax=Paraburkholderia lycopersici TaxID=416944 RepID=A0A1G7CYH2_9BURK|nr:TetR/AcrR family transcriptional regulator [Paraburkholderia lycopersici]SDE44382.1 regulatory protein, tetR family [Paraburkholderia lycopersici]